MTSEQRQNNASTMGDPSADDPSADYDWQGLVRGMRTAFTVPGLVMAMSFLGFGALVRAIAFPLKGAVAMDILMWALPGQVVYVDTLSRGLALLLALLAVTLTAVRLMPMVVLVLARARLPGARRWPEYLAAHFIAATLWVMSEMYMEGVPRRQRVPWVIGLGLTLMSGMVLSTFAGYHLTAHMPTPLAAMLVFFTPAFFILALLDGARERADWAAIVLGALIGPIAHLSWPEIDLLLAGIIGGSLAMLFTHRGSRAQGERP